MALLKYIFFLFLLTISLPGFLNAQKYFSSQYITTQDGLSNNKITCLHEDIKGNLWIGTEEGLTRFNGVIFEKYFADINQPTQSLSSNFIKYIVQQNDSLLLISTQSGVNVFNLHTDRFENNLIADLLVRAGSGTDISALRLAGGKKILIATNDRIIIADEKLKTIKSISTTTKWGERFYVSQNNIYIDNDSTEFIFSKGKYGGNAILDLKNDSFFSAVKKFSFLSPFENTPFGPLFHANNGLYFYSAYSYGFFVHDTSGNHTENFEISPAGGEFNSVNMIITDVNLASTYWLATGNGLYLFNASDKKLTRCIISTEKDNAPAGRGNYLLIDTQKTLWFGTSNGLYKLTCNAMSFEKIFELEQHGLPEDGLNLCFADAKGRAWFGSFGSGLFEKEMYQSSERVKHFVECGMLITKINSVAGRIYAASEKGLMFFDEGKQKFLYPSFYPDSLKGRIVTDFNFDKGGIFRLGLGNGLGMTE
ncbi:MAG: hypothetical protein JJE25_01900, partial [Bacteroidia bacterium]|nr:hypothetical protein [Bacteroidia bacterium]